MTNKHDPLHLVKTIEEDIKSIAPLKARIDDLLQEISVVQRRISEKQDLLRNHQRELEDEIKKF